jgi:hypothetical protein
VFTGLLVDSEFDQNLTLRQKSLNAEFDMVSPVRSMS